VDPVCAYTAIPVCAPDASKVIVQKRLLGQPLLHALRPLSGAASPFQPTPEKDERPWWVKELMMVDAARHPSDPADKPDLDLL
jgi:hypothetical protein